MRMPGQNVKTRPVGLGPGTWTNCAISPRGTKGYECRLAGAEAYDGAPQNAPETVAALGLYRVSRVEASVLTAFGWV